MNLYIPERGDMVRVNMNPQSGHEQSGRRPAIILSPSAYNRKTGLALMCPVTTQEKGYPFEVRIPDGLKIRGVILSDHIKNLDWNARTVEFICKVPDSVINEVLQRLSTLLRF